MYSKHIFIHINTTGSALHNNTNTMYTSMHLHANVTICVINLKGVFKFVVILYNSIAVFQNDSCSECQKTEKLNTMTPELHSVCLLEATATQSHLGTSTGAWIQIFNVTETIGLQLQIFVLHPTQSVYMTVCIQSVYMTVCLIEQISMLTFSTNSTQINIDFKDMQRQSGEVDCGLFAIASAACLCEGTDPSVHAWNQDDMRKHLNDCFETGTIQLFKSAKRRNRKSKAVQTVPLHCLCRTGRIIKKDMILCEQCHLYYHYTCVNLSAQPKERFTCQNCNV